MYTRKIVGSNAPESFIPAQSASLSLLSCTTSLELPVIQFHGLKFWDNVIEIVWAKLEQTLHGTLAS